VPAYPTESVTADIWFSMDYGARHCSSHCRRLLRQASERKFIWVAISMWLASVGVISFRKATLLHPPRPLSQAPPSLWSSRWMVMLELFTIVVAWPSSATNVVLGSTSGSCCRACDAPSRMLCRVGLGGRLGRLSRLILTAVATSLESDHCVVATCLVGCVVRLVVEGPISFFLLFVVVLLLCLGC
jgi:hypothetical protein